MSRTLIVCAALTLCAAGCGGVDATAGTLSPLGSPPTIESTAGPMSPTASPQRAWYQRHRRAIDEEAAAIRSFVARLSAATTPYVLAMTCTKGIELDRDTYRTAYDDADVPPDWIHAIDLTRWMIASCHNDARRSVHDVLPQVVDAIARVGSWLAEMAHDQPAAASPGGEPAAGSAVFTPS
jgi:hypothetical protein